jgi:hypothetical protein
MVILYSYTNTHGSIMLKRSRSLQNEHSRMQLTLLSNQPSPSKNIFTYIYLLQQSLSLTHTHIYTQIIILNLQPPCLTDQFYTLLQTNLISADMLRENFNIAVFYF